MKKIVLIAGLGVLALASCKKEHTCICTKVYNNPIIADGISTYLYETLTERSAEKKCSENDESDADSKTTCALN